MTRSKHPKRCETCKHYQTRFEYGNKKICTLIKERAPGSYQIGIPFHIDIVGCASHSSASEPVPEPNPCEENGCTDIEICDEICEHTRIYSPAYVRESRQKTRADVLDTLKKDLETRFIPSSNSWSRGRNSGLLECCNIIDEYQQQQEGKP